MAGIGLDFLENFQVNINDMGRFVVGELYPDPSLKGIVNTGTIRISENGFDMAIIWKDITVNDVQSFRYGPFTYGIFEKDLIPFITIEFELMIFNVPFNVLSCPSEILQKFLDTRTNAFRLYFVDADSYIIKGLRAIGLEMEFVDSLKEIMTSQLEQYHTSKAVDLKIHKLWTRLNTRQMIREAKRYKLPGSL